MPLLVEAREIVAAFQAMIRKKSLADLEPWLERARSSLGRLVCQRRHQGSSRRQRRHLLTWSNGQTEGQITKLKLVKRQMYGRGKLDLRIPPRRTADYDRFGGLTRDFRVHFFARLARSASIISGWTIVGSKRSMPVHSAISA